MYNLILPLFCNSPTFSLAWYAIYSEARDVWMKILYFVLVKLQNKLEDTKCVIKSCKYKTVKQ